MDPLPKSGRPTKLTVDLTRIQSLYSKSPPYTNIYSPLPRHTNLARLVEDREVHSQNLSQIGTSFLPNLPSLFKSVHVSTYKLDWSCMRTSALAAACCRIIFECMLVDLRLIACETHWNIIRMCNRSLSLRHLATNDSRVLTFILLTRPSRTCWGWQATRFPAKCTYWLIILYDIYSQRHPIFDIITSGSGVEDCCHFQTFHGLEIHVLSLVYTCEAVHIWSLKFQKFCELHEKVKLHIDIISKHFLHFVT